MDETGPTRSFAMGILQDTYFARNSVTVARDLIGKMLVRKVDGKRLSGRIVETEAYREDDPACHGCGLRDEASGTLRQGRGVELYGPPGTGYVYLCYGIHWLLNVVTEPEGTCGAVLIRAVEPVDGLDEMRQNRAAARRDVDLTSGPGKLAQAFGIDGTFHDRLLTRPPVYFSEGEEGVEGGIEQSARIGITQAVDRPWRFFAADSPFVSKGTPSDQRS